ncbi:MAG: DUF1559 domain-containing protein, partial [Pirellulaceae bacterium]|nr:DUF1559 domain-containing protein [Pirellulaceae bacterium]
MHMRLRAAGFTLGELLVVIAIIGVLVALLLPAVQSAREAARRVQCANNLRQIAIALQNYDANFKVLPYGSGYPGATKAAPSWLAMLLPYVERQGHYDLFNFDLDLDDPANQAAMTTPVKSFMCPSDGSSPSGVLPARCTCCNLGHPYTQTGLWYPGSMGPVHRDNCALCSDPNPSDGNFCCQGNSWGNNGAGPGMFFRFPRGIRLAEVTDGTSNTII